MNWTNLISPFHEIPVLMNTILQIDNGIIAKPAADNRYLCSFGHDRAGTGKE
jgi:hypothetical protein